MFWRGHFVNRGVANPPAEWNAIAPPHAAAICYQADIAAHESVGIDFRSPLRDAALEFALLRLISPS